MNYVVLSSTMITENFSWAEASISQTAVRLGIDNSVPEKMKPAVINTAKKAERVRALLCEPMIISSWYRCPGLQALPKFRNPKSQHAKGEAIDFISPRYGTPLEICKKIIHFQELIGFDQLILEHDWVHISWNSDPNIPQRGQVLSLLADESFAPGLTDKKGKSV